jgi:hypothetical protein
MFGIPPTYLEGLYFTTKTDHSDSDFGGLPQSYLKLRCDHFLRQSSFPLFIESACHSTLYGLSHWQQHYKL